MVEVRSGGFAIEVCLYDVGPAGGSQDRYELTATRTNCLAYSPPLLHLVSTYLSIKVPFQVPNKALA